MKKYSKKKKLPLSSDRTSVVKKPARKKVPKMKLSADLPGKLCRPFMSPLKLNIREVLAIFFANCPAFSFAVSLGSANTKTWDIRVSGCFT